MLVRVLNSLRSVVHDMSRGSNTCCLPNKKKSITFQQTFYSKQNIYIASLLYSIYKLPLYHLPAHQTYAVNSFSRLSSSGTCRSLTSRSSFSSSSLNLLSASSLVKTYLPCPSNCRMWVWYFHRLLLWLTVMRVMPRLFALSYMIFSVSSVTLLVHSSRMAYLGRW